MFYTNRNLSDSFVMKIKDVLSEETKANKEEFETFMESFDMEMLEENLGVFKSLSKDLMYPFVDNRGFGGKGSKLSPAYGQNSKINRIAFNNPSQIEKTMSDGKFPGLIIRLNDVPIMTVSFGSTQYSRYSNKKAPGKVSIQDRDSVKSSIDIKNLVSSDSPYKHDLENWYREHRYTTGSMPKTKKAIAALMKIAKNHNLYVDAYTVSIDYQKLKTQVERDNRKTGAIALMKPEEARQMIKNELMQKLKIFKLSKNQVSIEKKEDVIRLVEKSLPKTFSIKAPVLGLEIFYEYREFRNAGNMFDASIKGSDYGWRYNPEDTYVEYKMDRNSEKAIDDVIEKDSTGPDGKLDIESYKTLKKKYQDIFPGSVKILMEMDGLSVKPTKVIYDKGWF